VAAGRAILGEVAVRTGQKLLRFDRKLGARYVAGADEAGRGSLAGPLVVAGVLLAATLGNGVLGIVFGALLGGCYAAAMRPAGRAYIDGGMTAAALGKDWRWYIELAPKGFLQPAPGYGFNLAVVYFVWLLVVAVCYLPCKWYAGVKARSTNPLLSYL